nr:MAG TPA: hypothetical protein [Caudoviricetes sp.]
MPIKIFDLSLNPPLEYTGSLIFPLFFPSSTSFNGYTVCHPLSID